MNISQVIFKGVITVETSVMQVLTEMLRANCLSHSENMLVTLPNIARHPRAMIIFVSFQYQHHMYEATVLKF